MKFISRIALLFIFSLAIFNVQAKSKTDKIYAFAVATSFNDSVVYISAINALDFATIDKKSKFLNDRLAYSNQFKHYLDGKHHMDHTSALFFSKKKDALEKKYSKLRRFYQKNKELKLVEVAVNDFKFQKHIEEY